MRAALETHILLLLFDTLAVKQGKYSDKCQVKCSECKCPVSGTSLTTLNPSDSEGLQKQLMPTDVHLGNRKDESGHPAQPEDNAGPGELSRSISTYTGGPAPNSKSIQNYTIPCSLG